MLNLRSRNKDGKVKSIGQKLSLIIILVLLVVLSTKVVYDGFHTYSNELTLNEKMRTEQVRKYSSMTQVVFGKMNLTLQSVQLSINQYLIQNSVDQRNREEIKKLIVDFFKSNNEGMKGLGVFFEPNVFDNNGRFSINMINDNSNITFAGEPDFTGSWYKDVIAQKTTLMSDPYKASYGTTVLTLSCPLEAQGKVIGVCTVDVDLEALNNFLVEYLKNDQAYIDIINENGMMVANSSKPELIGEDALKMNGDLKELISMTSDGKESIIDSKNNAGKNAKFISTPLPVDGTDSIWAYTIVDEVSNFTSSAKRLLITSVITNIISLIFLAILIYFLIDKYITKPLRYVKECFKKMANYDFNIDEEKEKMSKYQENKDDIGDLVSSGIAMNENIKTLIASISSESQHVAATSEELTATAQSTLYSATDVASAVNEIADGATKQAHDTTDAAQNIQHVKEMIDEVANELQELNQSVITINEKKDQGQKSLKDLMKAAAENNDAARDMTTVLINANERADRISEASEMIQSIADQTNLLALNAAIEAARAGEAGKGFSVVADEIRKLAEQSAGFTAEIKEIIDELKSKTQEAVDTMSNVGKLIEYQTESANDAQEKFNEISDAVDISEEIIEKINNSTRGIEESNNKVVEVIEYLAAIAEEYAATSEEVSASVDTQTQSMNEILSASEGLAHQSTKLQNLVAGFKI